jgi:acyl transferase domain-containing protein
MSQCYPEDPKKPRQGVNPKYGNFLEDPFAFDAAYFNISPREAKCIDPQQRLLLHGALEALDDAGYSPDSTSSFQKDTFGVYVGIATGDYVDNLRDDIDVYYSPGMFQAPKDICHWSYSHHVQVPYEPSSPDASHTPSSSRAHQWSSTRLALRPPLPCTTPVWR